MIRSVRALWRSAFGVGVLGLTMLGVVLWWLGVITIDVGARFKTSSSQPMLSESSKPPVNLGSLAKTTPTNDFHLFEYTSTQIDAWKPIDASIEIDDKGRWQQIHEILSRGCLTDEQMHPRNLGESPQEKRADDRQRVMTTRPPPPPLRYVARVRLNEIRGNLRIELQLQITMKRGSSMTSTRSTERMNHRLALTDLNTGWSSTSPPFPAGVTEELTLLSGEIKRLEKDREVTRLIRLQVRPSQIAPSRN